MTPRERIQKNLLFLFLLIYYLGGYILINWLTSFRTDLHRLALPGEAELPFVPVFIFAYTLIFGYLALGYVAVDDLPFFRKMVRAFVICVTFHFVVFLVFPVEYTLRPEVDPDRGWLYLFVTFYYFIDLPYNSFPSMHISNAFLVSFLMNRYRPGIGRLLHPVAVVLAISVVLVKQHYIVDVVSGFFVGWLCYRVVFGRSGKVVGTT